MKDVADFCGIDIAKHLISIHLEDENRKVISQRNMRRANVLTFFANKPPCLIGIESCGGSQYWALELRKLGHDVRLMNAKYVIPYRRKGKNDLNDAEAICEAVTRPSMSFVAVKTEQQQSVLMMHRLRQQCLSHRKSLINQVHGYLLEFGVSLPKGAKAIHKNLAAIFEKNDFEPLVVEMLHELLAAIAREEERETYFNKRIEEWVKQDEQAKALLGLDGIGPLSASAIVATAGDAAAFKNGRQFAAWLGLVPRQYSSGGKSKLGRITKAGDQYLRTLLIQCSRSVLLMANRGRGKQCDWINELRKRRPDNVVAVAMAAKQARMAWAIMAGKVFV
ncbi:IS110 family transposase [Reinekea sp.]|jgi:transposase|uniref:IS110 family transposase n=2 Tax=Reinekea sp. TaxID=1970455 RepID=UPI0039897F6C